MTLHSSKESELNSDAGSEDGSLFEVDIDCNGAIRPFMLKPQHDSSSEDEILSKRRQLGSESEELEVRSLLGTREWCKCSNCQVMATESECICCQETDVLGDRLDLGGRKKAKQFAGYLSLVYSVCNQTLGAAVHGKKMFLIVLVGSRPNCTTEH